MAEYNIELSTNLNIDFSATGDAEILQNVAMIFSSVANSCPMNRKFAWDGSVLDRPVNLIQSIFAATMVTALRTYEPRASLVKLTPSGGTDGTTIWTVRVRIEDE
ncbi:phage baseplate assembly protein W [Sporomusaceae bacterium BoRhaA]|uniref:hypothetical protein n=1 Tax=Pelorhabdus rhamnosifermentans TaxID=2772457 RepID=UPI001C0605B8|nr:hypothetical protein [Pelorhabdus rhamnosifermentans]MBU2701694.1 phage baseplate assembly protein W [Pelorhabdus rhamnosifermentans]